MNISAEEKLMYDVMKAIYESGIPISFKGSMVLKACLIEAGYSDDTRHTVDIDANWNTDIPPSETQMVESIQNAISKSGIGLKVGLYRMFGENRSAGFELTDTQTGEVLFTMDVDVNRHVAKTKTYEVAGMRFCGVSPVQMIADKVEAISTDRVFRRIKDVVDLYYISSVFPFDRTAVIRILKEDGKTISSFSGFLYHKEELRHAYEKFRFSGDVNKPPFEEVYSTVKAYIKDVIYREQSIDLER